VSGLSLTAFGQTSPIYMPGNPEQLSKIYLTDIFVRFFSTFFSCTKHDISVTIAMHKKMYVCYVLISCFRTAKCVLVSSKANLMPPNLLV